MKRLVPIAALALLSVAPVKADLTKLERYNLGRNIGWIQATCVFAQRNNINQELAELTIKVVLDRIANAGSRKTAIAARKITLKKYPKCLPFMPREYLVD